MRKFSSFISVITIFFVILSSTAYCQTEGIAQIIKDAGGTVKISLPADYELMRKFAPEPGEGALFQRKSPFALFSINIYTLRDAPSSGCNDPAYQRRYLENIKRSLADFEMRFEENNPFFNSPTLIYDREIKNETSGTVRKIRDVRFLKDCKLFSITFGCDKDNFDEQWKDMEARIRAMGFLE